MYCCKNVSAILLHLCYILERQEKEGIAAHLKLENNLRKPVVAPKTQTDNL
jgi:hypothetical protein